jgi:PilS N terminal
VSVSWASFEFNELRQHGRIIIVKRLASSRSRQRGVSLLEAIAYLGVAASIIVGAVALLTSAFSGVRSNRAQEELTAISTGVRRLYMSQAGAFGTGNMNAQLATAKIFPSTLAVSGETVRNSWNGEVNVVGNTTVFDISYANVPQEVCIELMSATSQFISVAANGAAALTPPVTVTQAAEQCNNAQTNAIVWTAR